MVSDEWLDRYPSKFNTHSLNPILRNFCQELNIFDRWRQANPNKQLFSWYKPVGSIKSHLDFWLTSDTFLRFNIDIDTSISAAPLTDHCLILLSFSQKDQHFYNKGYWKFNSSLLRDKSYCNEIAQEY